MEHDYIELSQEQREYCEEHITVNNGILRWDSELREHITDTAFGRICSFIEDAIIEIDGEEAISWALVWQEIDEWNATAEIMVSKTDVNEVP
ncbi:MAG: hypothetical protein Q8O94_03040 [bacterium]|nr:hypothetical protein [bacterium]